MPWRRKGKVIEKYKNGKWIHHRTYDTIQKAINALKWLRANYGHKK